MLSQIAALVQETSVTYASLGHTSSVSRCLSQPTRSRKVECRPRFLTVTIQWPNQTTYPLQIYDSGEDDFYSRAYLVKTSSSFRDIPFFTIIFGKCVPNINLGPRTIHHPAQKRCQGKGEKANPLSFFQGCGNLLLSNSSNGAVETKPFLPSIVLVGSWWDPYVIQIL